MIDNHLNIIVFQTSCHEDSGEVNASMVSDNSHRNGDPAGASHASTLHHNKHSTRSSQLTCVPEVAQHEKQTNIELQKLGFQKLDVEPGLREHLDTLWLKLESIMGNKIEETKRVLEVYGISEGEEDSETEEGQIWRMVQGDAPYTLNLV